MQNVLEKGGAVRCKPGLHHSDVGDIGCMERDADRRHPPNYRSRSQKETHSQAFEAERTETTAAGSKLVELVLWLELGPTQLTHSWKDQLLNLV